MEITSRVILVDDHALFRNGLKHLLDTQDGVSIVGEATDGVEFMSMVDGLDGDEIVLLDIDMPGIDGFEAAERAMTAKPRLRIITLSMHSDEEYYFRMVALGVKGFLLKNSEIDEVVAAIHTVEHGGSYFSQELLFSLVDSLRSTSEHDDLQHVLSQREREILLLITKGFSNQEIADRLFISKRTVDKHRANILDKTATRNTANLVVYAIKNGLVEI